jgi:hypothetical protein
MEIQVLYYSLVNDKVMGDGSMIPQNKDLTLIKKDEDGLMFFETHNDGCKSLFWATDDEVKFEQTSMENWDEEKIKERNSYINGEFL